MTSDMIVGGLVAGLGLLLALNVARAAERLARLNRPYPWWVKWPLTDDPAGYRVVGAVVAAVGAVVFAASAGLGSPG
jgi:hypothetical protein